MLSDFPRGLSVDVSTMQCPKQGLASGISFNPNAVQVAMRTVRWMLSPDLLYYTLMLIRESGTAKAVFSVGTGLLLLCSHGMEMGFNLVLGYRICQTPTFAGLPATVCMLAACIFTCCGFGADVCLFIQQGEAASGHGLYIYVADTWRQRLMHAIIGSFACQPPGSRHLNMRPEIA